MIAANSTLALLAPTTATLVLLAAFHRLWLHRRRATEWIAFSVAGGATALAATTWPGVLRISLLPPLLLVELVGVFAFSAWRFAPDFGQRGWLWICDLALRPAFVSGAGIAVALLSLTLGLRSAEEWTVPVLWLGASMGLLCSQRQPPARPFEGRTPSLSLDGAPIVRRHAPDPET